MRKLLLASSSRYRAELLQRLELTFSSISPDIDESPQAAESAEALVIRLARSKARAVADRAGDALVIGSDQVALCDGRILGKPGTAANARAQLAALSGRDVQFLTGLCLLDARSDREQSTMVPTRVRFRQLSEAEIADYVAREQPLDCAGAFKSEALGIALFEAVESRDPTALIGLPLIALCAMLRAAGCPPLGSG